MAKVRTTTLLPYDKQVLQDRLLESQVQRHEHVTTLLSHVTLLTALTLIAVIVAYLFGVFWATATVIEALF